MYLAYLACVVSFHFESFCSCLQTIEALVQFVPLLTGFLFINLALSGKVLFKAFCYAVITIWAELPIYLKHIGSIFFLYLCRFCFFVGSPQFSNLLKL